MEEMSVEQESNARRGSVMDGMVADDDKDARYEDEDVVCIG
jgi:hypothetical protein